jgi:hypothetical protein
VCNHIEAQPTSSIIINEVHDMTHKSPRDREGIPFTLRARFIATKEE